MSDFERSEAEREAARQAREARRKQSKVLTDHGSPPSPKAKRLPPEPPAAPRVSPTVEWGPRPPKLPLSGTAAKPGKTPKPARIPKPPKPPRPPKRPTSLSSSRPPRGRRSPRRIGAYIVLLVFTVIVAVVAWFLISLFQPFHGSAGAAEEVVIPPDSSTSEVGTLLHTDGVVSSSFFFKLRAQLSGDHFSAGDYKLAKHMSYGAALTVLSKGPRRPAVSNVTIIPGKSRYQLNALLKSQKVRGSYSQSTLKSKLLNPTVYGAPKNIPSLEGFLYPDTYQLRKPISIPALVADQLTQFKKEMATVNLSFAKSKNLTAYDVLIIASLEDAEAAVPSDLPKVASVIYNRLKDGMDLGLDTTAAYAANNYTGNLTNRQLSSSSPWNTLNHPGLPPTPIDSPDLAAINAAAHPATTNYTYFIVKVCGDGSLNFTSSYSQFLAWSAQYSASLAKKGANKTEFCGKNG